MPSPGRTFRSYFPGSEEGTLPCLHVTHGLLCPSPGLAPLDPLPKYVKVNPSAAAQRACYLKLDTIMAGVPSEDPPFNPWKQPFSALTPAPDFSGFSSSVEMSLPVVLPGSCCPVTGASQLAEPPHRNRPRGLSASSRIAGGGSRLLLPGRPLLSLGLLQLLLGGSMVALSFGALSLSNSPPIRNSCPFWAGSSVSEPRAWVSSVCMALHVLWRRSLEHRRLNRLSKSFTCCRLCEQSSTWDKAVCSIAIYHFKNGNDDRKHAYHKSMWVLATLTGFHQCY